MTYNRQDFSKGQELMHTHLDQLEENIRSHVHGEDGVSALSRTQYHESIAAMRALSSAPAVLSHQTLGYYSAGDGGGADYYWDAASTATDDGGSVIKITAVTTGRFRLIITDTVYAKSFGVKADGTTDDYAAVNKAITSGAKNVIFPSGVIPVSAVLTQPDQQKWIGSGGERNTKIKKMFNGDLVLLGDQASIVNISFDSNGATYTGRTIYSSAGYSQLIEDVHIDNSYGVCLEFALNSGGGAKINNFTAATTNPTVVPAIKIQDNTAVPRFFTNIWLSGGLFDFSGGGNGNSLIGFYIRNFVTSSTSGLMHITSGRVASLSDTTTLSGADVEITNVAFSGPVYLDNAQDYHLHACTFGTGITENSANCQYNSFNQQNTAYTPVWDQASGTQPSLGNGTLSGSYVREGYTCAVSLRLVIGSTTTTGNSSVSYRFSLPFPGHQSIDQRGWPAKVTISSVDYACWVQVGANEAKFTLGKDGQGVRDGYPAAWATGSTIDVSFSYKVR